LPLLLQMPLTIETSASLLKKETRAQHTEAEKLLIPVLRRMQHREEYAALLKTYYGFFELLYSGVCTVLTGNDIPDLSRRNTSSLILDDLQALGQHHSPIPVCNSLPPIRSRAAALGALYVAEGSMLGGQVIAGMLKKKERLALSDAHLHYFNGYGADTMERWHAFLKVVNEEPDTEAMVSSANAVFAAFQSWIRKTLYHG
jgi:heme oxygenase